MAKGKQNHTCRDSFTSMVQIVMPNDTNPLNNLMGGNLLKWMDMASGISAAKHAGSVVVTAAVDSVSFERSIKLGDVVTIESMVTRSFNTSMEVFIEVFTRGFVESEPVKSNEAFYTFVALDTKGNPCKVPPIIAETEREKKLYNGASRRREMRLVLAGRMKPQDASELKSIFMGE